MALAEYRTKTAEMTGSGDEVLALDPGYFGNFVVISGRNTGSITIKAKPRTCDVFDVVQDGVMDLTQIHSLNIQGAMLEELQFTADEAGAYTVTVFQYDNKLDQP